MKLSTTLSAIALLSLNVLIASSVTAQTSFNLKDALNIYASHPKDKAEEVRQDNEFVVRAETVGSFFDNPLLIDDHSLDYTVFNLKSKGELTLVKEGITGRLMQIPFCVYLRRNGTMIKLHDEKAANPQYLKVDISIILKLAQPGDQLIIDPVNREDWQAKRILKLLEGGC